MKCRVCEQEMRDTRESHHLEYSPIDRAICLGCWIGWLELEKFLIRATGATFWSLSVEDAMRAFLRFVRESAAVTR